MAELILASASPRRKELMAQIGLSFEIITSSSDELITKDNPCEIVMELANGKAEDVYKKENVMQNRPEAVVIGADTIVVLDDAILGKPRDKAHAIEMISSLQGRSHQVYTGVSFVYTVDGEMKQYSFYEKTDVHVFPMNEAEILGYVETKNPQKSGAVSKWDSKSPQFDCEDKAGSYGIQGPFAAYIEGINGDYNNVVGLPVARVYHELKRLNFI